MAYIKRMSIKTKLLIYEYKERYPAITPEQVSELFNIDFNAVSKLFTDGEITVPSKINPK